MTNERDPTGIPQILETPESDRVPDNSVEDGSTDGADAVCFTAGFGGAVFGIGTIHAYLAADRKPPLVAAGISMGALSAAAMQRCYRDLLSEQKKHDGSPEVARWEWFRRYANALIDQPFDVIWDGLPRQSDFFADMVPVKDPTVQEADPRLVARDHAKEQGEYWSAEELNARRELSLFVKLGNWLAALPVSVSQLGNLIVTYIRKKEHQVEGRRTREFTYPYLAIKLILALCWHVFITPKFVREWRFRSRRNTRWGLRPLLGWRTYLVALTVLAATAGFLQTLVWAALLVFSKAFAVITLHSGVFSPVLEEISSFIWTGSEGLGLGVWWRPWLWVFLTHHDVIFAAAFGILAAGAVWLWKSSELRASSVQYILKNVELQQALVYDFHLRLKLDRLFREKGVEPLVTDDPMKILLVAAPLQTVRSIASAGAAQLWPQKNAPLIDCLYAAIAQPGLFRPLKIDAKEKTKGQSGSRLEHWLRKPVSPKLNELDLVDGNAVRQNPLPALFTFLRGKEQSEIRNKLCSSDGRARVHVVYNVPLGRTVRENESQNETSFDPDIVATAKLGLKLNKRRDTSLEVEQTNFMSGLERITNALGAKTDGIAPIFADEIAPISDITFENRLSPKREEILKYAAEGCRCTLERLYQPELKRIPGKDGIQCKELMELIGSARAISRPADSPGLPEICGSCTKVLGRPQRQMSNGLIRNPDDRFKGLSGTESRIVFVASGGVFRGAFHVGMLGCLLSTQIRPDVIIGNSVGTLMGGALGALLCTPDYTSALRHLRSVVDTVSHVDQHVAFTKTFKSAARELGIRARAIYFSPKQIRERIREGGKSDPAYAVTGAPPVLVDALSNFFLIPHKNTTRIAARFVSGHVSQATKLLIDSISAETLRRLNITRALIGTSLLETDAYKLLGGEFGLDLTKDQPFLHCGIAFFSMATDMLSERTVVFGRDFPPNYDKKFSFLEAALASSAFPAIFAPRRQSAVFPGIGQPDILYSDGGVFDNIPFLPVINILGELQRDYRMGVSETLSAEEYLMIRHKHPDLFIAGSLDVSPEQDKMANGPFDTLFAIQRRAKSLASNVKIKTFEWTSSVVNRQIDSLLAQIADDPSRSKFLRTKEREQFLDGIVDAAVLSVFPADRDHLNPTYAFCASTGLDTGRLRKSIADGCFQSFAALANAQAEPKSQMERHLNSSVRKLVESKRIPVIKWAYRSLQHAQENHCPYFVHSTDSAMTHDREFELKRKLVFYTEPRGFICPFAETTPPDGSQDMRGEKESRQIFRACCKDDVHVGIATKARRSESI